MRNPIPDSGSHHINAPEFEEEGERHSILVPILLALFVVLAAAGTTAYYTYHKDFAAGTISSTIVYPIHREEKAAIQVVGTGDVDILYLLPLVQVHDHISLPLFIESLAADVTTADGATYHCTGAQNNDFAPMYAAYPDLAHMVEGTGDRPLQRDTRIENNGGAVHGLMMFHFPISEAAWQHRQSASVTISFYHQQSLVIPFPANP
jgi:hypothetical protein